MKPTSPGYWWIRAFGKKEVVEIMFYNGQWIFFFAGNECEELVEKWNTWICPVPEPPDTAV